MKIIIKTPVKGHFKDIIQRFDQELFEALAPDIGKIEIVSFTGSKKGDKVHIRFLSPVKTEWISKITEDAVREDMAYFVDEGVQLPWPLKEWKHRHVVEYRGEDSSIIIDDIYYKGVNALMTLLLYPALYLGFYPRKPKYRAYFGKPK